MNGNKKPTPVKAAAARTLSLPDDGEAPRPPPLRVADRYVDQGPLGDGGQASVRLAWDERLERVVALKILRQSALALTAQSFVNEGQTTARLTHPGIVAVHDRGVLPDGRPWFAMAVVDGQTLADLLWERRLTFRQGVRLLARVADIIEHAHVRGVVHLDLKPDNIMLDAQGNPYVLDWGIARVQSASHFQGDPGIGVLPGAPPTATTDVYALGRLLQALLSTQAPDDAESLAALARAATAADPAVRPQHASDIANRLHRWLDGAESRAKARALLAEAQRHRIRQDSATAQVDQLRQRLAQLPPSAERTVRWQLEDQADAAAQSVSQHRARTVQALHAALTHEPELTAARLALAEWYRNAADTAHHRHDHAAEAVARSFVERHDVDGRHADWLAGLAHIKITTRPERAHIDVHRVEVHQRRLRSQSALPLSATLPHGSWLVRITHPDRPEVRLPVWLERGKALDRLRPGGEAASPVVLPPHHPEGCAYVPAGWARIGGDPHAPDPISLRRVWVDSYFIQVHPVTVAEYATFLQAQSNTRHLPTHADDPTWVPIHLDGDQVCYDPRVGEHPITLVSWHDALAYAAWRAAQDDLPWRLPMSVEWEKAARGVDGRFWPWGNHCEPEWARMYTGPTPPGIVSVFDHPEDVSIYGVHGMGGNVRDWCADTYARVGPKPEQVATGPRTDDTALRVIRGGCWASLPDLCRSAGRFAAPAEGRFISTGFRLAISAVDL